MSQACDTCRVPCGANRRRAVYIYLGRRWCSRCWKRMGFGLVNRWYYQHGYRRLDWGAWAGPE